MKKLIFVVTGVLLAVVVLSAGCTTKPAPKEPTQTAGILKDVNTPAEAGKDAVTVQTTVGPQTFPVTPSTQIFLEGQLCGLDDLNKVLADGNTTYTCTLLYDYEDNAVTLNVLKENK